MCNFQETFQIYTCVDCNFLNVHILNLKLPLLTLFQVNTSCTYTFPSWHFLYLHFSKLTLPLRTLFQVETSFAYTFHSWNFLYVHFSKLKLPLLTLFQVKTCFTYTFNFWSQFPGVRSPSSPSIGGGSRPATPMEDNMSPPSSPTPSHHSMASHAPSLAPSVALSHHSMRSSRSSVLQAHATEQQRK